MVKILLLVLILINPFKAEVRDYKGQKLERKATTMVYYQLVDDSFYISTGFLTFNGKVKGEPYCFIVTTAENVTWYVSIINPEHLVLTCKNRTIIIKGV